MELNGRLSFDKGAITLKTREIPEDQTAKVGAYRGRVFDLQCGAIHTHIVFNNEGELIDYRQALVFS